MKHILLLFVGLLCLNGISKAQDPVITMTTAMTAGETISFYLAAQSNNTTIQVDFGNGIESKTLGINPTEISGSISGSHTIKVYGNGINHLECFNIRLTALDVTKCTSLKYLYCDDNLLTVLDISKCTALKFINCNSNLLTALDVTRCTTLTGLYCYNNQLTALDVTKCTSLTDLYCNDNQLTALDVTKCTSLTALFCNDNQLTALDVTKCTSLKYLYCDDNQLTALDVTKCTALTKLYCYTNQLTELDVTQCTALTGLYCVYNPLRALDVTKCTALTKLYCYTNQLTELDVTQCTALTVLHCSNNQLTALDVTKCTALTDLNCFANQLTLATLPLKQLIHPAYFYSPQSPLSIPAAVGVGNSIDLSSQATISGNATTFTWKTASGTTLSPGTDYTINNGVTTFLKTQTKKVYCQMTNATFPNFKDADVLTTTEATITASSAIDSPTTPTVEVYAVDATLYLNLPTATQVSVTDLQGHIIASTSGMSGHSTLALPGSGLYVVRVMAPNGVTTHKVMVK